MQRAAFAAVRPGAMGGDIYVAAERQLAKSKQRDYTEFLAHGMGLVSHEAPRLTAKGPIPYDDTDARLPLETGMVVSVETTMKHPKRGFIKLEDTVAVTATGYEIFGEGGRGWNARWQRALIRDPHGEERGTRVSNHEWPRSCRGHPSRRPRCGLLRMRCGVY